MNNIYILLITVIILITPILSFLVSMLFFYKRKENDRQLTKLQDTLSIFPKRREVLNQSLIQSKLEIQEQALDNIAKELHSNIGHLAALININLSEIYVKCTPTVQENVRETKSLAKQLMAELSTLSLKNSDHIIHTGFAKAWEQELNRLKRYKIIFNTTGETYSLSPDREIILFRLCQEILNNIVQHAKAKSITVSLNYLPTHIKVKITDDGVGFNIMEVLNNRIANRKNSGIIKIQERALHIKATVDMSSKIGRGTNFVIDIYQN